MMLRSTAAAVLVFTAITWAQSASPVKLGANPVAGGSRRVVANSNAAGLAENARAQNSARQSMEEMGARLAKMHALLKQMQARNSASASKDPLVKANLEMWALMVADLDKQYEQLRTATLAREDMEARRAAMYKQAEEKAAAAARNAQQNLFPAKGGPTAGGESSAPTGKTPAAAPSSTTPPSTSPN